MRDSAMPVMDHGKFLRRHSNEYLQSTNNRCKVPAGDSRRKLQANRFAESFDIHAPRKAIPTRDVISSGWWFRLFMDFQVFKGKKAPRGEPIINIRRKSSSEWKIFLAQLTQYRLWEEGQCLHVRMSYGDWVQCGFALFVLREANPKARRQVRIKLTLERLLSCAPIPRSIYADRLCCQFLRH